MKLSEILLLQALKAALEQRTVDWETEISREDWNGLLSLARIHRVLPLVYQAVYDCPAARAMPPELKAAFRDSARRSVMMQTQKTGQFLPILEKLRSGGVRPLVVKGIVCRNLYPNPDQRMSGDEDLWIPSENRDLCFRILREAGLVTDDADENAYEIPFRLPGTSLYLEIHTSLFPPENRSYGDFNRFFTHARERSMEFSGIPTLNETDHLLYLILHAFKHFLHSGFGIRQVCDIVLWANAFGEKVDWEGLLKNCRAVRAEQFAAGIFRIGWNYLNFFPEKSGFPLSWQEIHVQEEPLLADILCAGVYGSAQENRTHSSRMTLSAVESGWSGGTSGAFWRTLFPDARDLQGRYPYLREKPYLLPVAWAQRIFRYSRSTLRRDTQAPLESVRIGRERLELLRRYGIIDP